MSWASNPGLLIRRSKVLTIGPRISPQSGIQKCFKNFLKNQSKLFCFSFAPSKRSSDQGLTNFRHETMFCRAHRAIPPRIYQFRGPLGFIKSECLSDLPNTSASRTPLGSPSYAPRIPLVNRFGKIREALGFL